jgi:hypothetical protein
MKNLITRCVKKKEKGQMTKAEQVEGKMEEEAGKAKNKR